MSDFSAFGEVELLPLTRIQKLAAGFLTHSWTTIPHVTHHDAADISSLEQVRKELSERNPPIKLSPLPFLMKAAVTALRTHPKFNASLDATGTQLILKKYFNIGVAIDTPTGLVVGVVRHCDRKDLFEIADEVTALSRKARAKGLSLEEMSGGCFTISSLGNSGGTAFTPIINAPEVAILGVSKAQWTAARPSRADNPGWQVEWRLMLPLSLSYDHRAVNGVDAAKFMRVFAKALADVKPEQVT